MDLFKKDVSFLSKEFVDGEWGESVITKEGTFKELSRTDRDQHKLHFMLVSIFKASGEDEMKIDSDQLYDITVRSVKILMITDDKGFTEQDKTAFLQDGGALIDFGMWFLKEKISPFFSALMKK